jgi:hypothetical protein
MQRWDASRICATMRSDWMCRDGAQWTIGCVITVRSDEGCVITVRSDEMFREVAKILMMVCSDEMCREVAKILSQDVQCVMFRDAYLLISDCKLRCLLHLSPYLDQKLSQNCHQINFEEPVPVWGLERPSSSTGRPSSSTGPVTILVLTYTKRALCLGRTLFHSMARIPLCHESNK